MFSLIFMEYLIFCMTIYVCIKNFLLFIFKFFFYYSIHLFIS